MQERGYGLIPCRIDGIVAREANLAVLFRRGPSKQVQQLLWDLSTDTVTPGQWIKGQVYTKGCDVSPDGRYLALMAARHGQPYREQQHGISESQVSDCWTAISRPPHFTALAIWFMDDVYTGGGCWASNRTLDLDHRTTFREGIRPSPAITVRKLGGHVRVEPVYTARLERSGWTACKERNTLLVTETSTRQSLGLLDRLASLRSVEGWQAEIRDAIDARARTVWSVFEKPISRGCLRLERVMYGEHWILLDDSRQVHRVWKPARFGTQFLDVDAAGRVIFGEEGCLWVWAEFPDGKPRMVADLNDNLFENVPPPDWAKAW